MDIFGLGKSKRTKTLPEHLQRRPKWRKSTYKHLDKHNPKTADGKNIDVKKGTPIEPGDEVIGHQNQSWREYQEDPANTNKSRAQVIEDYNDTDNLGYEDKKPSSRDGGRLRGHEH